MVRAAWILIVMLPALNWLGRGFTVGLGADPASLLLRGTGWWSLVWLLVLLALPPVAHRLKRPGWLVGRRTLGLAAFGYGAVHVLGWAWWECNFQLAWMFNDIVQRPFVLVGTLAFLPLVIMAATSTSGWQWRLGVWWFRLHRGIHVAALLSVLHFWLLREGKNDMLEPGVFGAVLVALWLVRRMSAGKPARR